ncbi:MAG TPA: NnrU family protein, partial [Prochlorococcaceae cyanobacterium AMR_MDS_5431]|nr:NnrU family protein [Prochlorococcaceae cyanobacterium AMR_MDS_5431]
MLVLLLIFATIHSGGAALRSKAEVRIGPRMWRLLFAILSVSSASIVIGYFLSHYHDGVCLWNLQKSPISIVGTWILTAISFVFLYPATYNLLEIPAILMPRIRLYGNGIIRVTRHPQAIGQ